MANPKSAARAAEARSEANSADSFVIARRLSYVESRVIGFLPASPTNEFGPSLLFEMANALSNFVSGDIGVIPNSSTWTGQVGGATEPDPTSTRVFGIIPPPCDGVAAATAALEVALAFHESKFDRILVDLSGFARAGELPGAADLVAGIVVLVASRRTRRTQLKRLLRSMPPDKNLGAILLG